ncbi:hypothetical protein J1605_014773 [Eschrichtius robustus]|uniref:Uncharacterized protein n=1 Tax=Eschrichtius robustus TaxID=9764 RepID=A0AB34GFS4_ESCRO|nr:hypothetical protein J1605_014773 [Eschrichtius robustus]
MRGAQQAKLRPRPAIQVPGGLALLLVLALLLALLGSSAQVWNTREEADNNEDPSIEEEDLLTLNSSPSTAKDTLDNGDYGEPDYDWTTSPRDDESNEALEENRSYMEIEQFSFWFKAGNGVMVFVPKQWNIIV